MTTRTLIIRTAVALGVLALLAAILVAGGVWITVPITLAALIGMHEYFKLMDAMRRPVLPIPGYAAALLFPALGWYGGEPGVLAALFILLMLLGISQVNRGVCMDVLSASFNTFYGAVLIAGGISFVLVMRNLGEIAVLPGHHYRFAGPMGIWWVLTTAIAVSMADTGGHLVGANFGRRKLSVISPNKTIEGAAGGVAGSILAMLAGGAVFKLGVSAGALALLGLACGLAAVLGDLMESLIKRLAGIKDSGGSLPGLGGFLDFFDSAFAGFPVVYLCLRLLHGL